MHHCVMLHLAGIRTEPHASRAQNPFGDAKPREAILAAKTGRTEEEIVREEASKTKIHVRCMNTPSSGVEHIHTRCA